MMLRLLFACTLLSLAAGHGRLWWPSSRSTLWRHGFDNPANYNDNELFCGGFGIQQGVGGKCGICGDPYEGLRPNEPGPDNIYANGIISDTYDVGETMSIEIDLTANHMGWFEFRLCPNNDPASPATQACLDQYLLELADGSGTRWQIPDSGLGMRYIDVRLPAGLSCSQCVLQWKYNCGNSWGRDPDTGHECVGCGPQEQFYGCADIAIGSDVGTPPTKGPTETQPTNSPVPTPSAWVTDHPDATCKAIGDREGDPAWDKWCHDNCTHFPPNCPADQCRCELDD